MTRRRSHRCAAGRPRSRCWRHRGRHRLRPSHSVRCFVRIAANIVPCGPVPAWAENAQVAASATVASFPAIVHLAPPINAFMVNMFQSSSVIFQNGAYAASRGRVRPPYLEGRNRSPRTDIRHLVGHRSNSGWLPDPQSSLWAAPAEPAWCPLTQVGEDLGLQIQREIDYRGVARRYPTRVESQDPL